MESIEQLKIISNGFNLYAVPQLNEVPSINEESDLKDLYSPTELYQNEKSIDPDGTYEVLGTIQSFTPYEYESSYM